MVRLNRLLRRVFRPGDGVRRVRPDSRAVLAGLKPGDDYSSAVLAAYRLNPGMCLMHVGEELRRLASSGQTGDSAAVKLLGDAYYTFVPNDAHDAKTRFYKDPRGRPVAEYLVWAGEADRLRAEGCWPAAFRLFDILWEAKGDWKGKVPSLASPIEAARRAAECGLNAARVLTSDACASGADPKTVGLVLVDTIRRCVRLAAVARDEVQLAAAAEVLVEALDLVQKGAPHWAVRLAESLVELAMVEKKLRRQGPAWVNPDRLRAGLGAAEKARSAAVDDQMPWVVQPAVEVVAALQGLIGSKPAQSEISKMKAYDLIALAAKQGAQSKLVQSMTLKEAVSHLHQAGDRAKAAQVLHQIRELNRQALDEGEFDTVEFSGEVPRAVVDNMIQEMFAETESQADVLAAFAAHFHVSTLDGHGAEPTRSLASELLVRVPLVDDRALKSIAPGTPEMMLADRRTQIVREMCLATVLLFPGIMEWMRENGGVRSDDVIAFVEGSIPGFSASDRHFLHLGMMAMEGGAFDVALHLLVPRTEQIIRLALASNPSADATAFRDCSMKERPLGELVSKAKEAGIMKEELSTYIHALLTDDDWGLNLRNRVAHGLVTQDECSEGAALRLVHLLLVLARQLGSRSAAAAS